MREGKKDLSEHLQRFFLLDMDGGFVKIKAQTCSTELLLMEKSGRERRAG